MSRAALLVRHSGLLLLVLAAAFLGILSPSILAPANLLNVLAQASAGGIVAVGMTFALLTAGIDLSVASVMFIAAAVTAKLVLSGTAAPLALAAGLAVGSACGLFNGFFIVRLGVMPFVVTLSTLYIGKGLALHLTETRALNLPDEFLLLGQARPLGIPLPVAVFLVVLAAAHLLLTRTPFGRQALAVGNDPRAAARAGIDVGRVLWQVYLLSGGCAALGGLVLLLQIGAVNESFGEGQELLAVATAVLGGTSLFGGRGSILPGVAVGALLLGAIRNALDLLQVNVYTYPLITAAAIFLSVLIDGARQRHLERLGRRRIRPED